MEPGPRPRPAHHYRAEKKSVHVLLSNSQAGPGRNLSQPRTKTFFGSVLRAGRLTAHRACPSRQQIQSPRFSCTFSMDSRGGRGGVLDYSGLLLPRCRCLSVCLSVWDMGASCEGARACVYVLIRFRSMTRARARLMGDEGTKSHLRRRNPISRFCGRTRRKRAVQNF